MNCKLLEYSESIEVIPMVCLLRVTIELFVH